ncbi:MAG TPA: helix-turn-helix transcriptional regulator [Longilinea sp.]|nr:helix-turn-helix transcriptional regulator [Longilinea sp.]
MNHRQRAGPIENTQKEFLLRLNELHISSGLSLREVALVCDIDPTYVHYILKGVRHPRRDVLIALGFAYNLDLFEMDEILILAGLPPLGRSSRRDFQQTNSAVEMT